MKTGIAFSGGGIRALRTLQLVKYIEATYGPIQTLFDCAGGTSTGGILALGLFAPRSLALSAVQLERFYFTQGPKIFNSPWYAKAATVFGLKGPKYRTEPLRAALVGAFSVVDHSRAVKPTYIPTYDLTHGRAVTFINGPLSMVDVALATTAAETYFPPTKIGNTYYVDGGTWANNPAGTMGFRPGDLCLSLGTGIGKASIYGPEVETWGAVQWIEPALNALQNGAMQAVEENMEALLDGGWCHLDGPTAAPAMDDASASNMATLMAEGQALLSQVKPELDAFMRRVIAARDTQK